MTVAAALAIWIALHTPVPVAVPDFALRAAAVYRLEVGAAIFAALYFASMAIVLAFNNQAFTELGTGHIATSDIGKSEQVEALERLGRNITVLHEDLVDKAKQSG